MNRVKTSTLVPFQLPDWIRYDENTTNFVLFLQSYYEWLEQNQNVLDLEGNILDFFDVDKTTDQFLEYFINDFLQYFPKDSLISKSTAIKAAKELYSSKGTPSSYKFLFRILFDSDFEFLLTKDLILKPSNGNWFVPKSLKLLTNDEKFLNAQDYRIFGETTKSIAVVENSILNGDKTDVYISYINAVERSFQSGEYVRLLYANNQNVIVNGNPVRAKIVGQVNKITIDPNNRGLVYQPGDPVIVYGGLSSSNGVSAIATVADTTTGSLDRINVVDGGFGYRPDPNTIITVTNVDGATAKVGTVNPDPKLIANVTNISIDSISLSVNSWVGNVYSFFTAHPTANINTRLIDALSFTSFTTYPISSILVTSPGSNGNQNPIITATSVYTTTSGHQTDLSQLGILGPIQIVNGGRGYRANDRIIFSDGTSGFGAYANVTNVSSNGAITSVSYVQGSLTASLGGNGYNINNLPTLSVISSNVLASNASLVVTGILGKGATFSPVVSRIGQIKSINLISTGEDYSATPNVSLMVQDIVVCNVDYNNLPVKGDVVYQNSTLNVISYTASVNSISLLQESPNTQQSLYNLRVFNYSSNPDPAKTLKLLGKNYTLAMANSAFSENYNSFGVRYYGDGRARASASITNGLFYGEGRYLDQRGHLSSYDVLESELYNNYTYQVTVEKEIARYKSVLLNLIHPTGTRALGKFIISSNTAFNYDAVSSQFSGRSLKYYTGYPSSYVKVFTPFELDDYITDYIFPSVDYKINSYAYDFLTANSSANVSCTLANAFTILPRGTNYSNVVQFISLAGADIGEFIFSNSIIEITTPTGPNIKSEVVSVNSNLRNIILKDKVWLTYPNVAIIQANSGSNVINILTTTGSYDIVNNGEYSNPYYPLLDVVFAGDLISIPNNTTKTVTSTDILGNKIYVNSVFSQNSYGYLSVNRTINSTNVTIWNSVGTQYIPQLITEDGLTILTESGSIILLG